ncbi:hypothetical protein HMPREF1544_04104 [Mucor circinelloides 1006PhL]|uniref:Uncharacterized protein n=1 Tax=Mucor circinelloides f. circinelloides (strain 1006PhL) TaxID=1220926 RepID=S2JKU0_MUCC1|nr:hypothetical protein HMPREF1544_04104 [Mucor circinelloides 1006PhL]
MTQQTLGIISLNLKDDILSKIAATPKVNLVYQQPFELTIATSLEILEKTISKALPVYGFILEGSNAIRDWSQITSAASLSKRRGAFVHASTVENAQHQVDWFKNLVLTDLAIEKNTSTASSTSSSSIPIKVKKQQKPKSVNVSDNSPQRKPLRSSTAQQQPPSARLATTTAARKPAVSTSNRSKIPNANVKAKPVPTRPTSATTATKVKTPATSSVTPTKRVNDGMKPTSGRRGSLVASTLTATSSKKLLNTTAKGGVIKNTPPVSVLTGRTRKPSRLTEKRPVIVAAVPEKIDSVQEEQADEIKPETQEEALSSPSTPTPTARTFEDKLEHVDAQEAPCDNMIQEQQIVSYPSTCSSAATDEHDAEVAATTSKKDSLIAASSTQTTAVNNSSVPLLCNSGRSSFSPNSVASLPRPETPEVDQLRLRFETIIQTSAPVGTQEVVPRRPSSKLSQHELASRIKEMKPRGPVGSRVKSMVELFMDENLNKWEF